MPISNTQPQTLNFLTKPKFEWRIKKLPNVNWFVQKIRFPGISIDQIDRPTPFISLPVPGDHIYFNNLIVTFKIDENMNNYMEIWNWLMGIGYPDKFDEYAALIQMGTILGNGLKSDAALTILDSQNNPNIRVTFQDLFPTTLSDVEMDTTDDEIAFITATSTFAFRKYYIEQLVAGTSFANTGKWSNT